MKKWVLGILIVLVGVGVYLYPNFVEWRLESRTNEVVSEVRDTIDRVREKNDVSEEVEESEVDPDLTGLPETYNDMVAYNEDLIKNGQELIDVWSYAETPVTISGIKEGEAVGYIEIPDMDVTLPLYIGASEYNMSLGAAVMSETSMPVGGDSTNSVIVGHRGYSGAPYFREIERLSVGSLVHINTLWDEMVYRACEIKIIDPHDLDSILIQPGKDMVTLLTCHPYMSHGKQRYVVFCERVDVEWSEESEVGEINEVVNTEDTNIKYGNVENFESSEWVIEYERLLRIVIPIIVLGVLVIVCICRRKKR